MQLNHRQPIIEAGTPNRITTAFRALSYLQDIRMGVLLITPGGRQVIPSRALTAPEVALHNIAVETIRHYIGGELYLDGEVFGNHQLAGKNSDAEGDDIALGARDSFTGEVSDEPTDDYPF